MNVLSNTKMANLPKQISTKSTDLLKQINTKSTDLPKKMGLINGKRHLIQDIYSCTDLLNNAIDIHNMHLEDPTTATPESYDEMIKLMPEARDCIINKLRMYEKGQ